MKSDRTNPQGTSSKIILSINKSNKTRIHRDDQNKLGKEENWCSRDQMNKNKLAASQKTLKGYLYLSFEMTKLPLSLFIFYMRNRPQKSNL